MLDKFKSILNALAGEFLWAVILVPILAISWLGFYTIARAVGVPPIFAAGMSAAFDGVALFAARIGLKHRRKGFSGWLARIMPSRSRASAHCARVPQRHPALGATNTPGSFGRTAPVAAVLARMSYTSAGCTAHKPRWRTAWQPVGQVQRLGLGVGSSSVARLDSIVMACARGGTSPRGNLWHGSTPRKLTPRFRALPR